VIKKLRESRGWQLFLISALILLMPLLVDVNGRISVIRRMRQEETRLEQELTQAQAEQDALQEQLEFVASDDYLEQWARVEARMTLPGQVVIIPLQTQPGEPAQTGSLFTAAPPAPSIPEQWRRLFFGDDAAP
jgi:cell division protein FtsB